MAKVRFVPNRRRPPVIWPETGRLLRHVAGEVAIRNNAGMAPDDPRRVVAESSSGLRVRRHRAAVIAVTYAARRDQAKTNRLLSALSRTRV